MPDKFTIQLYTKHQLSDAKVAERLWKLVDVPLIAPKKYDSVERAKQEFTPDGSAAAAELYANHGSLFVRGAKDGFVAYFASQTGGLAIWTIYLDLKAIQGKKAQAWLDWVFALCDAFPILFGSGYAPAEYEAKHGFSRTTPTGGRVSGRLGVSVREFSQFLPGIYWLTLFGPELTSSFSLTTLKKLPHSTVTTIPHKQAALQLDGPVVPEDMPERLKLEREIAQALGTEHFFDRDDPDRAYKQVPALAAVLNEAAAPEGEAKKKA